MPLKARPIAAPVAPLVSNLWLKGLGSWTKVKEDTQIAINNGLADPLFAVDLGYKQTSWGVIGGYTMGREALFSPYDAVSFGPLGGYIQSNVSFNQRGTSFRYTGGTVGFTASYLSGGWFFDNLVKADFLKLSINSPDLVIAGLPQLPETDVRTWGWIGTLGYRWDFRSLFFEPTGTLAWSTTKIDDLATLNQLGADLSWDTSTSFKGAIGGRLGAVFAWSPAYRVETWVLGRWWGVFDNSGNNVLLATATGDFLVGDPIGKKSFGEVKGGVDMISLGTGWGGFVNAGVKFNEDFTTYAFKAGATYRFLGL
jgi:hypothetical protein